MTALVIDASALVELVRVTPVGHRVRNRIADARLHGPQHCTVEVVNALRGLVLGQKLSGARAASCLDDFVALRLRRRRIERHLARVWELRDHLNAYDAAYVVLAEFLGAALITCDAKLATSQVRRLIDVEVIR